MTLREAHSESCRRRGWSEEKIALRQKMADSLFPTSLLLDSEVEPGYEEEAVIRFQILAGYNPEGEKRFKEVVEGN